MIPDSDLFLELIRNKEQVLKSLLEDLSTCDQNMQAFQKLEMLYRTSPDTVKHDKAMAACAQSLRHLNEVNKRLIMLLLVYTAGDSFPTDAGKVLIKMGRGEDALREMFRQKMGGN